VVLHAAGELLENQWFEPKLGGKTGREDIDVISSQK